MTPYGLLAALALWAGSLWFAYGQGRDSELAAQYREQQAVEATRAASPPNQAKPLVVASCPLLAPLGDDSFGAWVLWAQYAAKHHSVARPVWDTAP